MSAIDATVLGSIAFGDTIQLIVLDVKEQEF